MKFNTAGLTKLTARNKWGKWLEVGKFQRVEKIVRVTDRRNIGSCMYCN